MKTNLKKLITRAFIVSTLAVLSTGTTNAQKATLKVQVEGIKNNKGNIMIGVGDSTGYKNSKQMHGETIKSDTKGVTATINDLPVGTCYVYLYHDENKNSRLEMQNGIPTEGYGFATRPGESPYKPQPTQLKEGENTITIKMVYLQPKKVK